MFSVVHDQSVIYGLADNTHTQHSARVPHELHVCTCGSAGDGRTLDLHASSERLTR